MQVNGLSYTLPLLPGRFGLIQREKRIQARAPTKSGPVFVPYSRTIRRGGASKGRRRFHGATGDTQATE